MTIRVTMPCCSRTATVSDQFQGRKVKGKCPRCGSDYVISVPALVPPATAAPTASPVAPEKSSPTLTSNHAGAPVQTNEAMQERFQRGATMPWVLSRLTIPVGRKFAGRDIVVFQRDKQIVRVPARIGGRYDITGVLAAGGMGAVLRAADTKLGGRPVLIKVGLLKHDECFPEENVQDANIDQIIDEHRQRLEEEARSLLDLYCDVDARIPTVSHFIRDYSAQLHGPHGASGWYWEQGHDELDDLLTQEPYLVMGLVPGENLRDLLRTNDPCLHPLNTLQRARTVYDLGRHLASLLAQFHRRRSHRDEGGRPAERYFVFQDLKPDNIIRTPMGDYFLIDFGTVRDVIVQDDKHNFSYKPEGTRNYWAPETSEFDVSEMSDLYSLGATLYHMATGNEPPPTAEFPGCLEDAGKNLSQELFVDLLDIVGRCTLADPDERRQALAQLPFADRHRLPAEILRHHFIRQARGK